MNDANINFTKEAFLNPWNLTFLIAAMATAFGVSMIGPDFLFEIVLLFAAALELVFLGTVPRQERFRRAVRARAAAEHAKPPSKKEIWRLLNRPNQKRYYRLRDLEKEIEGNYRKLSYASQGLLDSHIKKIDGLLDSYLNLLYQKERYEQYSQQTAEREVVHSIQELREDMADDSDRVRAIKARRLKILEQRLERFKRSHENLEIIEAQLETIEDVIKYIHEQSLTLRNPEEISFQLDMLLSEVEETEASVEEIEEVFAKPTDLLTEMDTFDFPQEQETPERQRLRN
jgi:vacuolar-type H+-ATPase subunit I/STV1